MLFVQPRWHGWKAPFVHWTPPNGKCPDLGSNMNPLNKYDASAPTLTWKVYAVMQFVVGTMITLG